MVTDALSRTSHTSHVSLNTFFNYQHLIHLTCGPLLTVLAMTLILFLSSALLRLATTFSLSVYYPFLSKGSVCSCLRGVFVYSYMLMSKGSGHMYHHPTEHATECATPTYTNTLTLSMEVSMNEGINKPSPYGYNKWDTNGIAIYD